MTLTWAEEFSQLFELRQRDLFAVVAWALRLTATTKCLRSPTSDEVGSLDVALKAA
jgi:hypothetical protein